MTTNPDEQAPREAFVDTNLFLRVLLDDIPEQTDAVARLLDQAAKGQTRLKTNTLVVAEIVWVLSSLYKLRRKEVGDRVASLLEIPGLEISDVDLIRSAISDFAEKNVDFIDAYNAAWAKKQSLAAVYTFDRRHYSRFPEIRVLAPE